MTHIYYRESRHAVSSLPFTREVEYPAEDKEDDGDDDAERQEGARPRLAVVAAQPLGEQP